MQDYGEMVRQVYFDDTPHLPLNFQHALLACYTVWQEYPPKNAETTLRLLVALNLLNAYVKMPGGQRVVSYAFIKGYAGLLFQCVAEDRETFADIAVYWDEVEDVTYFQVAGIQVSFHHVIFSETVMARLPLLNGMPQQWDGLRLQLVAEELFMMVLPDMVGLDDVTIPSNIRKEFRLAPESVVARKSEVMLSRKRLTRPAMGLQTPNGDTPSWPVIRCFCYGLDSLRQALHFNVWKMNCYTLYRRPSGHRTRVMRFQGNNDVQLNGFLREHAPWLCERRKESLYKGKHYYVTSKMHIECVPPSRYHRLLAQNHYRLRHGICWNLCITYGIALYLAQQYPKLRFINTLNCNRESVRTIFYSYKRLLRVPFNSPRRRLKVWLLIDTNWQLRDFDISRLPTSLLEEYLMTSDVCYDYRLEQQSTGYGLKAYERFHLLETTFRSVIILHHLAHVENWDGKKAIYSLLEEKFRTDFIYDEIWYDCKRFAYMGSINGQHSVIYQFKPWQEFEWCRHRRKKPQK